MPEKKYPVSLEVCQRRNVLIRGYSAWGPGKGAKKNIGLHRGRHYVNYVDAALEMGYASEASADRAVSDARFELPLVILRLPPDYRRRRYVRRAQLEKILKNPPVRMRARLEKKGLARSSG